MIAGGGGNGGGRRAAVDMGNYDALHPPIQKAQDGGILMIGNAGDGGNAKGFGGPHHIFHLIQVQRPVFAVNHHKVEADRPENFHGVRGVAGDDSAEYRFAGGQFGLGRVGSHSKVAPCRFRFPGQLYARKEAAARGGGKAAALAGELAGMVD